MEIIKHIFNIKFLAILFTLGAAYGYFLANNTLQLTLTEELSILFLVVLIATIALYKTCDDNSPTIPTVALLVLLVSGVNLYFYEGSSPDVFDSILACVSILSIVAYYYYGFTVVEEDDDESDTESKFKS